MFGGWGEVESVRKSEIRAGSGQAIDLKMIARSAFLHEAGHAILYQVTGRGVLTIKASKMGSGHVIPRPLDRNQPITENLLRDEVIISLAGQFSEILGETPEASATLLLAAFNGSPSAEEDRKHIAMVLQRWEILNGKDAVEAILECAEATLAILREWWSVVIEIAMKLEDRSRKIPIQYSEMVLMHGNEIETAVNRYSQRVIDSGKKAE